MKRKATALILTAVFVLTGCGKGTKTIDTTDVTDNTEDVTISSSTVTETEKIITESLEIDISNYTDTANGNYETRFCFESDKENGETEITSIPREKIDYLVSYIQEMDIPSEYRMDIDDYIEDHEGHTYFGYVYLEYRSTSGKLIYLYCNLFDQYPEGFTEFIDTLNEIDDENEDIIFGEPIEMTPVLFNELSGCSDEKVTDGTAMDVYLAGDWDLYSFMWCCRNNGFKGAEQQWSDWPITRSIPTEVRNVESTEEELRKYAEAVAAAVGTDPSNINDDGMGGLSVVWNERDDHFFDSGVIIYRTCALPDYYEYGETPDYICHAWYLDGGEYRKEDKYHAYYSKDGKFIILFSGWNLDGTHDSMMEFTIACKDLLETR